jgi:pimeloyl-ACP methyl ester carboxylesterase
MKIFSVLLFIIFGTINIYSQRGVLIENKAILFSLEQNQDTIDFIIVDTTIHEKKPIFLWCQGSLPIPLFCEIESYGYYFFGGGVTNFNIADIVDAYHLVVISMPKTPVFAKKENLNKAYQYTPYPEQDNRFSDAYIEADYLENYVKRAKAVLQFLERQPWVSSDTLIVAGHSQGSKIASKIAVEHPGITHLGLFSANPFGRIDQYVRTARLDAQIGKISWQEADSIINQQYAFFEKVNNVDSIKTNPEFKAWKSFNETYFDDWLALDIPIYLAYGTEDRSADLCDIIPLFFIGEGKKNLTLKRYPGLEHNFFEVSPEGRPNYEKGHWAEVVKTFTEWVK